MEWNNKDALDRRIFASSYWRKIDNYKGLVNRAGVYVFANSIHQVKYVGKAGFMRMVPEISNAINRKKDYGATLVTALYTNSDRKALSLEMDLINKYNPPNNIK
jgi:excinuclease UvrABC nuclease subunit